MKVAISSIRTKSSRIVRPELIKRLQDLGNSVFYVGRESGDSIHPDYRKYNVPFLSVPIGRSNTNPFQEIRTIKETKKMLKDNNIEALIVYGIRTFPTMVIASKLAGVKRIVCIVNGSGRLFQLKGIKGFLVKFISYPMVILAFLLSDNILFQNADDLSMLKRKKMLWKDNHGIINGSGVNLTEFHSNELEKKAVFSMISRLTASKGVNEYIQAAFYVKKKHPNTLFHLIGPLDENDSNINMELLQKAIDEEVILLKSEVEDVRPFIKQCRIFILPSYYPEGVPRSILEAMAMGRPVITTDSPGCRETVIDGVNGFKVPVKDIKNLTEKMIWMINNPKEVEKFGVASRKLCEEKYDVHKVNEVIVKKIGCNPILEGKNMI